MQKIKSDLKHERFWSYTAVFVVLISIAGFVFAASTPYFQTQNELETNKILQALILFEGIFLVVILMLYINKNLKMKQVNADKEEALKLLEKRLEAIEAAADGIGIINPDGNLVYMNSALKKLHNIDGEEDSYIGQPWVNLYSENGRMEIEDYVLPYLQKHKSWRGGSPIVTRNGKIVETELTLKLLADGTMIGTARDMSEKQRANEEKKELEQQFYQAQKMEAVGRLAGGIAHDFNNILAAIFGYAEFLEEDLPKDSKERIYASNITKAGSQAKELVDQMLAFSRYKRIQKSTMNIAIPLKETLSMVKASFPKTIEVTSMIEEESAIIDGNATQISQIIMNLCVNARDAMNDDYGELNINLDSVEAGAFESSYNLYDDVPEYDDLPPVIFEDAGAAKTRLILGGVAKNKKYARLKISDTGSGMSRTIMEHIFEPFFTTKSVDKGTGLGLATVHGVIIGHCGALIIESELGVGSSFEMLFPVDGKSTDQEANIESDTKNISGARILLVEDQQDVQEMMINMLERMGYEVDACNSGLEGLHIMRDSLEYYDLVLTDHNMPKMSGLEMIQQIHLLDENIPFIMLSGYSLEKLQEMMSEHPAIKAILRKPINRKALQTEINTVLTGRELKHLKDGA